MTQARQAPPVRSLRGGRAGFVTRMSAAIIDGLLVIAVWIAINGTIAVARFMISPRKGVRLPHLPSWATLLCVGLLAVAMLAFMWATTGRSVGDQVLGLRVVRANGGKVGWVRSLVRALCYVVFPVGLVMAVFDQRNRSLQDVIVGTSVLYDWGPGARPPA
jgi:uncharacterized RDD family membrane protein YckC